MHDLTKPDERPATAGELFIESEVYKSTRERMPSAAVALSVQSKATFTRGSATAPAFAFPSFNERPLGRVMLSDILPSGDTDGNTIVYAQANSTPSGNAPTPEGTAKPNQSFGPFVWTVKTVPVSKVATYNKVTDEMYSDAAQMRTYIDHISRVTILDAVDTQIIKDLEATKATPDGTKPNSATGIFQAIEEGRTNVAMNSPYMPDFVILNSWDWDTIRKDTATGGVYQNQGPFSQTPRADLGQMVDRVFGLVVILTWGATGLMVGASQSCQVFYKEGIKVDVTNSNEDDFAKNLVAVRAEARVATALYNNEAVQRYTLT